MSLNPMLQQLADALDAMRDASCRYEDDPEMDAAKAKADDALDVFAAYDAGLRRAALCVNACADIPTSVLAGHHFAPADDEAPLYELVRD